MSEAISPVSGVQARGIIGDLMRERSELVANRDRPNYSGKTYAKAIGGVAGGVAGMAATMKIIEGSMRGGGGYNAIADGLTIMFVGGFVGAAAVGAGVLGGIKLGDFATEPRSTEARKAQLEQHRQDTADRINVVDMQLKAARSTANTPGPSSTSLEWRADALKEFDASRRDLLDDRFSVKPDGTPAGRTKGLMLGAAAAGLFGGTVAAIQTRSGSRAERIAFPLMQLFAWGAVGGLAGHKVGDVTSRPTGAARDAAIGERQAAIDAQIADVVKSMRQLEG